MNRKKIAFIACVNNDKEFAETVYYINRIHVPEGYEIDIIAVREADSMTAGYNAAMKSSDAKYKVYLHQDTFIVNRNFISEMLEIFIENPRIGLIGCIGCDNLALDRRPVSLWNTGKVCQNSTTADKIIGCVEITGKFKEVDACDGLLLATQYDVEWREDLFDGWDFYDVSQCMEMKRAGYQVAVAYQESLWCYHDNTYSNYKRYDEYYKKFIKEYQDIKAFYWDLNGELISEYESLREASQKELRHLVDCGEKKALHEIFEKSENKGYGHLRELEILAIIDKMEQEANRQSFWVQGDSYEELADKIKSLSHALKRMEYSADENEESLEYIVNNYSIWAICTVFRFYHVEKMEIMEKIARRLV